MQVQNACVVRDEHVSSRVKGSFFTCRLLSGGFRNSTCANARASASSPSGNPAAFARGKKYTRNYSEIAPGICRVSMGPLLSLDSPIQNSRRPSFANFHVSVWAKKISSLATPSTKEKLLYKLKKDLFLGNYIFASFIFVWKKE